MRTRHVPPSRRQASSRRRVRYKAPALEKGLDILELLASVSEALTHSEIASRLDRTINEVFRMLVCLEERGYISRTGADERYQLTLKLFEIVHHHHPLQRLISLARPLVHQVASETGQSCHLAMLNHAEVVIVAQSDAPGNMGFSVRLGANVNLLNTSSGHVILAFQNDEVRARALQSWRLRSRKPVPPGLSSHLNQIRRRGYEELASYLVHGVVNISYPVLNQHGEAIAAITVPFLARIGDSAGPPQVKEALSMASRELSLAVGGKQLELPSGTAQS
ncbi:MAG TPA: IclR family transcriptional regulator [Terriglobales bacterium]|nr:IclR family transcriptional regulator [Terriglobales bacterium]